MHGTRLIGPGLATLLIAALVACTSTAAPTAGSIRAEDPWSRPSMGMDRAGAVYVTLVNESGREDALLGAASDAAATVEIHETKADASGMMAMHPVDRISLVSGGRTELKPGGYHVMLIGLTAPLAVGDTIEVTLRFEHAQPLTIIAPVREG